MQDWTKNGCDISSDERILISSGFNKVEFGADLRKAATKLNMGIT